MLMGGFILMTVWAIVFTVALCLEVLFLNFTDITEQAC